MKKIIPIVIVVVLAGLIIVRLASNKKKIDASKQPNKEVNISIPVNVTTVAYSDVVSALGKSGKLLPFKEANITAIGSGKLIAVNFQLGSQVNEGGTIAQIDNRTLVLNLASAKLNKAKAEKDFKRFKTLFEGEAATETNYLDAQLNYENSTNQVDIIQKQIADAAIKAPISGQVIAKNVEVGEYVAPGTVLGKVVNLSKLKARVMVSEKEAYQLKLNQKVTVKTEIYPNQAFEGKVTFVSGQADAAFNYEVEITLDNSKAHPLKAGTYVYVDFQTDASNRYLLIPRSAIVSSLQNPFVYVVENNKAVRKEVVIQQDLGHILAVQSGINEGDVVITSGFVNVSEGADVLPNTHKTESKQAAVDSIH